MADRKPIVEADGDYQGLQSSDRLDAKLTNERLPQKTGIIRGWIPSIASTTTIDITAGKGFLVDNETDPENPTFVSQDTFAFIGVTVTGVVAFTFTYFFIDAAGLLQQQNTTPTRDEERTRLFVAGAYHPGTVLFGIYSLGQSAFEGDFYSYDFIRELGLLGNGNVYDRSTAAALSLKVSVGEVGYPNANRQDTVAARRNPHFKSQSAEDPVAAFVYALNDGVNGIAVLNPAASLIDTLNKSDGTGGITPLSGSNRNGIAVIYRDSIGNTVVEYTIADFNPNSTTVEEAYEDAITQSPLVIGLPFQRLYILEYPRSATDLDNCVFHHLSTGQSIGGGSGQIPHAINHEFGGNDLVTIENQAGGSTNINEVLQPKADGSVEWLDHVTSRVEGAITGIRTGFVPNGFTDTTVSFTAGNGRIVDNATNELAPIVTDVTAGPFNSITVTNVATVISTVFYVDSGGAIQQQVGRPTPEEERSRIYIGIATHELGVVSKLYSTGVGTYEAWRILFDLSRNVSFFSQTGNNYFRDVANALGIQVDAGVMYSPEINRDGTAAARRRPNHKDQAAETAISFLHIQDDGSGGVQLVTASETDIDVLQRDDGAGGLVTMANNRNTLNIIYRDPDGRTAVQYTTAEYNPNDTTAHEVLESVTLVLFQPWVARTVLEIPKSVTDLNDAVFHKIDAMGNITGGGGGGSGGDVFGPAGGVVAGEIPLYLDTTGKIITGSGITVASNVVDFGGDDLTNMGGIDLPVASRIIRNTGADPVLVQADEGDVGPVLALGTTTALSGSNDALVEVHVGSRDPNSNVTGDPGDLYARDSTTTSTLLVHAGSGASNSDWVDLRTPEMGAVLGAGFSTGEVPSWDGAAFVADANAKLSTMVFTVTPNHSVQANTGTIFAPQVDGTILSIRLLAGTPIDSGTFTFDVLKGATLGAQTSIFNVTPANRPSLTGAAAESAFSGAPDTTTFSADEVFTIDTAAIGAFAGERPQLRRFYILVRILKD